MFAPHWNALDTGLLHRDWWRWSWKHKTVPAPRDRLRRCSTCSVPFRSTKSSCKHPNLIPNSARYQVGELIHSHLALEALVSKNRRMKSAFCNSNNSKIYPSFWVPKISSLDSLAIFPECVARVPVSLGGLGVRLCSPSFAFAVATVGIRRQPSATVCVDAVMASASGVVPKSSRNRVKLVPQRRCLWEWSVSPQYIGVCRGGVCESDLCRRSYIYWCLQRRCLWERSVSPQLYWCLQRRCLWEWSVSSKSVLQDCLTRVPSKKCQVRSVK